MIKTVHPCDLNAWREQLQDHGQPLLLDVREASELRSASLQTVPGFTLLHIPMGEIPARLSELDPARPIACMCHHGTRSMRVAEYLANQGYAHVANVTGGINAWSTQVDATVPLY